MTMNILYKILVLILLAVAGFMLVPVTIHFTIWAGLLNSEAAPQGFLSVGGAASTTRPPGDSEAVFDVESCSARA